MTILNKWNKKSYKLVKADSTTVTLEREDGTQFTISRTEYNKNYFVVN